MHAFYILYYVIHILYNILYKDISQYIRFTIRTFQLFLNDVSLRSFVINRILCQVISDYIDER